MRWLCRHGYLDERAAEDRGNEAAEPSALDGCTQLALAGGAFLARPARSPNNTRSDADLDRRERRFSATCDGFDVHCAVRISAGDDVGRERLVRSCPRPPFALDPIEVLRDGRIAYAMKTPRRGRTHRVMTPMELMARLAALIPPPKIPFVRYHGVFASRSSWRALVTPKPPAHATKPKTCEHPASTPAALSPATPPPASPSSAAASLATPRAASPAPAARAGASASPMLALPERTALALGDAAFAEPVVHVEPTTITVAHWDRLGDGELLARSRHIEWAVRMKRSWGLDVLRCPRCCRTMRVVATITRPDVAKKILEHLGVRATPLTRAPARDRTWEPVELGFDVDAA